MSIRLDSSTLGIWTNSYDFILNPNLSLRSTQHSLLLTFQIKFKPCPKVPLPPCLCPTCPASVLRFLGPLSMCPGPLVHVPWVPLSMLHLFCLCPPCPMVSLFLGLHPPVWVSMYNSLGPPVPHVLSLSPVPLNFLFLGLHPPVTGSQCTSPQVPLSSMSFLSLSPVPWVFLFLGLNVQVPSSLCLPCPIFVLSSLELPVPGSPSTCYLVSIYKFPGHPVPHVLSLSPVPWVFLFLGLHPPVIRSQCISPQIHLSPMSYLCHQFHGSPSTCHWVSMYKSPSPISYLCPQFPWFSCSWVSIHLSLGFYVLYKSPVPPVPHVLSLSSVPWVSLSSCPWPPCPVCPPVPKIIFSPKLIVPQNLFYNKKIQPKINLFQ